MKFASPQGKVNIICAYSPTLAAPEEDKDRFFQSLEDVIKNITNSEHLYINGDFNARVGDGNDAWPKCLGPHGVGKINDNGQRLLEFCCSHKLCLARNATKSFGSTHAQKDGTSLTSASLEGWIHTHSYHSADCNSDHSLVLSKIKLLLKKAYTST
uniref:Endonuclease/exonuclease/phosphatase domain-containing protein n=1 Tax=Biomphalaria glabrata TaxID=6526 RepID=A0A2C9K1V3_BIOGL